MTRPRQFRSIVLSLLLLPPTLAGTADEALIVKGEVKTPLKLTLADLKALPLAQATIQERGKGVVYGGVGVDELLRRAGVPGGEASRGDANAVSVVVTGADGYQAVFALPELSAVATNARVVLAYSRDGAALDAASGPLHLIAPAEKRRGRWVRNVKQLELIPGGKPSRPR